MGVVQEAMNRVVGAGIEDFNDAPFAQAMMGIVYFLQSSLLQSGFVPPNVTYDMMLGQEAINLGIKEILRDGMPPEEFLARLNALDAQTAGQIIRSHLSEQNQRKVAFLSARGKAP